MALLFIDVLYSFDINFSVSHNLDHRKSKDVLCTHFAKAPRSDENLLTNDMHFAKYLDFISAFGVALADIRDLEPYSFKK